MKIMRSLLILVFIFCLAGTRAQWTTNLSQNTQVSSVGSGAAVPYVVTHTGGTSYISWFTPALGGDYYPWIQKLDIDGNLQWTGGGKQISSHPSMTWITDYSLAVSPDTGVFIAFQDMRDLGNDIFIYKLSPSGTFVWGDDGVQLSSNPDFEVNPVMAVQPDASVVVAWPRSPNIGDQTVILQRLSKNGIKQWNPDVVAGESGFNYTWPRVLPLTNGKTMLICYKEWGPYWAPNRNIIAQVYDSLGNALWNPKPILFTGAMPLYVHPLVAADGLGGSYVCWFYEKVANHLSTFVQHVDHNGAVTMAANGIEVSTTMSTLHLEPSIACDTLTHDLYVFWRETDLNQNVCGLYGQRVRMDGTLAWGTAGKMFTPLSAQNSILLSVTAMNGSAVVACLYGTSYQTVRAIRVDSLGNMVWPGGIKDVSTAQTSKGGLTAGPFLDDQFVFTWSDTRTGGEQIFAQNLDPNGNPGPVDYSFSVSRDTLYFLDPQAFIDGRSFYIRNPHDYPLDIQYIQQTGMPFPQPEYLSWYTVPSYNSFPVTIPPHDSILETVRWIVTDAMPLATKIVYDTLEITSPADAHSLIIAADSVYITLNTADKGKVQDFFAGPNPFTSQVRIAWNGSQGETVSLIVFNTLMQPVRTIFSGQRSKGKQEFTWDGLNEDHQRVSPGIYLLRLQTSSGQRVLRVVAL